MSGMLAYGGCWACGKPFAFNAELVPSIVVCSECRYPTDLHKADCSRRGNLEGYREPLCEDCVHRTNRSRRERGLELFTIPPGAYDVQVIE